MLPFYGKFCSILQIFKAPNIHYNSLEIIIEIYAIVSIFFFFSVQDVFRYFLISLKYKLIDAFKTFRTPNYIQSASPL